MKIVLYQPDIPQNFGSMLRLCACLGLELHVIEPCGFLVDEKRIARVAMDYASLSQPKFHASWEAFLDWRQGLGRPARLILFSTKAQTRYTDVSYTPDDMLLLGRESGGVPPEVAAMADLGVKIPLQPQARSLNLVQAACMAAGEALRQTDGFPQG